MWPAHRPFLLVTVLFAARAVTAQADVQMLAYSDGTDIVVRATTDRVEGRLFEGIWRSVPNGMAVFQLEHTADTVTGASVMLDRVVEAGLGAYLDSHLHFTRTGVIADLPAELLAGEMLAMVHAAGQDMGVAGPPATISSSTVAQLERLMAMQWERSSDVARTVEGDEHYLAVYRHVRAQRTELERQLRADLMPLSFIPVPGGAQRSPGATLWIPSTCGTVFDEDNYLCALDLQMEGVEKTDDAQLAQLSVLVRDAATEHISVRKRDRWLKAELDRINERLDALDQRIEIGELRDRIQDLEDRLTGLAVEIRDERADVSTNTPTSAPSIAKRGTPITLRFGSDSARLDPADHSVLDAIAEQLAHTPRQRASITAFADRSGNGEFNRRLGEQRADAVRNGLLERGVAPDRLIIRYVGEGRSTDRDPQERGVEVALLP